MLNGELEASFSAAVCDAVEGLVILLDVQGRILRWNRRCEEVTGFTLAEVQGAPFWDVLAAPEDRAGIRAGFDDLSSLGIRFLRKNFWVAKDGRRISLSWVTSVIRDQDGNLRFVLGHGVETAPGRSLTEAVEGSRDGFWEWRFESGRIGLTSRAAAILGFDTCERDIDAGAFLLRLHRDDENTLRALIDRHLRGETLPQETELRVRAADESWRWVTVSGRILARDESGRPAAAGGSVGDITERKRMEDRLRWESNSNRAIADLSTALASSCPLEEFSRRVLDAGRWLTGSDAGIAGYLDPDSEQFVCMVREASADGAGEYSLATFPRFSGLPGWMVENRQPVLTNDARLDPRSSAAARGRVPIARFLGAPSMTGDAVAGIVTLANSKRDYEARDLEFVQKVANLYALAVQRHRAEEAARQANERLRAVFEAAPLAIVSVDRKGGVDMWNPAAETLFGWQAAEVIGKKLPVLPEAELPDSAALQPAQVANAERIRRRKDGSTVCVDTSAARISNAAGETTGFMVAYVDATRRKHAEKVLRESEERYRTLFERNPHPMWVADVESGRFLAVNDAAVRQYGYAREEFASISLEVLYAPEEAGALERARTAVAAGETVKQETRHRTKDGAVIDVACFCHPFAYDGLHAALTVAQDITESKRAELARRESDRRYHELVDNFTVGVYRTTPDGRILMANPALLRMMGYSSFEQLAARNLEADNFEADSPRNRFRELIETLGAVTYEACWRRLDGSILYVRENAKIVRGEDGRSLYYEGVVEDVTERKRTEKLLKENEDRFRQLFEEAPIAYHEIDRDGIVRAVNRAECSLLGRTKEQLLNQPVWDMVVPSVRALSQEAVARKFSGEQPLAPVQREYEHANGASRFFEIHESFIHDAAGAIAGIRSAMVDITERKRVEQALRWNEARFRAVFEGAAIGIITINQEGNLTATNPALERMLGYAGDELLGRNFGVLALPEDRERDAQIYAEVLSGKREHLHIEKRFLCRSGDWIWVRLTASLVRDPEGRPDFVIGMLEDITERKKAEEALRNTVDELARSNAELEHFTYVASHDLQEPLRMVTSFMQLLRMRYKGRLDEDADEFIGYALEGSARMKTLVDDLLAYSRLGPRGKPVVPTNSVLAVEQAAANLAAPIEECDAVLTIDDSLPSVLADSGQLVQLFQNLIGNAIKFRGERRPEIRVSAGRIEDGWVFQVRDNGIGIEERYRERIFEIFSRLHTKAEYPGSGIGLAVAKKIVERHGGAIGVESEPGAGSTFWFSIPDQPPTEN